MRQPLVPRAGQPAGARGCCSAPWRCEGDAAAAAKRVCDGNGQPGRRLFAVHCRGRVTLARAGSGPLPGGCARPASSTAAAGASRCRVDAAAACSWRVRAARAGSVRGLADGLGGPVGRAHTESLGVVGVAGVAWSGAGARQAPRPRPNQRSQAPGRPWQCTIKTANGRSLAAAAAADHHRPSARGHGQACPAADGWPAGRVATLALPLQFDHTTITAPRGRTLRLLRARRKCVHPAGAGRPACASTRAGMSA
jgi:hypothetical protein